MIAQALKELTPRLNWTFLNKRYSIFVAEQYTLTSRQTLFDLKRSVYGKIFLFFQIPERVVLHLTSKSYIHTHAILDELHWRNDTLS
jgi:hypothetical protein